MIRTAERYARIGWVPFFLSSILVITWVAVEAGGQIFYKQVLE